MIHCRWKATFDLLRHFVVPCDTAIACLKTFDEGKSQETEVGVRMDSLVAQNGAGLHVEGVFMPLLSL